MRLIVSTATDITGAISSCLVSRSSIGAVWGMGRGPHASSQLFPRLDQASADDAIPDAEEQHRETGEDRGDR